MKQRILRYFRSLIDTDINLLGLLAFLFTIGLVVAGFWVGKDAQKYIKDLITSPVGLLSFIASCYGISVVATRRGRGATETATPVHVSKDQTDQTLAEAPAEMTTEKPVKASSPVTDVASTGPDQVASAATSARIRLDLIQMGPPVLYKPVLRAEEIKKS